jgi:hypothetical protein
MNAPQVATNRQTANREIREIESYIAAVRSQIDVLWHAARDATEPNDGSAFADEDNRVAADDAAFETLQCLRGLEHHLLNLERAL